MPIKRIPFTLVVLLILMFSQLHAQVSIGINAGINRMRFSGDPPKGLGYYESRPGLSSNLSLGYRFNDAFSLRIQPGIQKLRSKYVFLSDSISHSLDSIYYTFNSICVPLEAVVWSENGRFYFMAGIEVSYTLDFVSQSLTGSSPSYDFHEDVRDYHFFVHFGAGFIVPVGKPYLSFELRYSQGLRDINNPVTQENSYLPRTKLTVLTLQAGLHIPIGIAGRDMIRRKQP